MDPASTQASLSRRAAKAQENVLSRLQSICLATKSFDVPSAKAIVPWLRRMHHLEVADLSDIIAGRAEVEALQVSFCLLSGYFLLSFPFLPTHHTNDLCLQSSILRPGTCNNGRGSQRPPVSQRN